MELVKDSQRAYSVKSAAEQTSLSEPHLRNEIRDGNLKAKKVGKRVLILSTDLLNYLNGQTDWKPTNAENN